MTSRNACIPGNVWRLGDSSFVLHPVNECDRRRVQSFSIAFRGEKTVAQQPRFQRCDAHVGKRKMEDAACTLKKLHERRAY